MGELGACLRVGKPRAVLAVDRAPRHWIPGNGHEATAAAASGVLQHAEERLGRGAGGDGGLTPPGVVGGGCRGGGDMHGVTCGHERARAAALEGRMWFIGPLCWRPSEPLAATDKVCIGCST